MAARWAAEDFAASAARSFAGAGYEASAVNETLFLGAHVFHMHRYRNRLYIDRNGLSNPTTQGVVDLVLRLVVERVENQERRTEEERREVEEAKLRPLRDALGLRYSSLPGGLPQRRSWMVCLWLMGQRCLSHEARQHVSQLMLDPGDWTTLASLVDHAEDCGADVAPLRPLLS